MRDRTLKRWIYFSLVLTLCIFAADGRGQETLTFSYAALGGPN